MELISGSAPFPHLCDLDAIQPEYTAPGTQCPKDAVDASTITGPALSLLNVLLSSRQQPLLISDMCRMNCGLDSPITTARDFRQAQQAQSEFVALQFSQTVARLRTDGVTISHIWSDAVINVLEEAYKTYVAPAMDVYGRFTDPRWKAAMEHYRKAVLTQAGQIWRTQGDHLMSPQDSPASPEILAFSGARRKLAYLFQLREVDYVLDLPLLSPTYIEDSLKVLEKYTHTIRWVSVTSHMLSPKSPLMTWLPAARSHLGSPVRAITALCRRKAQGV